MFEPRQRVVDRCGEKLRALGRLRRFGPQEIRRQRQIAAQGHEAQPGHGRQQ